MSQVSVFPLIAGRYRLDSQVAADRFGEVWRGADVELARPVAVKMLHDGVSADAVRNFREGASRAGSLSHEGVVRIFDYCDLEPSEPTHRPLVVMEYVDGQSLSNRLREGPLEAAQAVDIIAQVSAAVHAVHQAGLAHGDIRPEKILLSGDGEAKLFGFTGAGPAANGADLPALGVLVRNLLIEHTQREHGRLPEQFRAAATEFAALSTYEVADQPDATAAFAHRAAQLAGQVGLGASAAGDVTPPTGKPVSSRAAVAVPPLIPAVDSPEPTLTTASSARQGNQPLVSSVGQGPVQHGMRRPAKRGRVIASRTAALIAFAVAAVAIFGAVKPNGTIQEAKGASQAASVRVTAAKLMGQPVRIVRIRLQRLGLIVRIRWQHSDRVGAGDVVAVRPTGLVPAHSTVVVVGSSGSSRTAPAASQPRTTSRQQHPSRAPRRTTSGPATPTPSSSPTSSPSPSPSPTSSPPSGSPSPSASPSPPSSSPPSTSAPPSSTAPSSTAP